MGRLTIGVLAVLGSAAFGQGPSFDCAKAATKQEKLVCADAELSRRDELLAAAYRSAREAAKAESPAEPGRVLEFQRAWLRDLRSCGDKECLRERYAEQMDLMNLWTAPAGQGVRLLPRRFSVQQAGCGERGQESCFSYRAVWFEAVRAPSGAALERINAAIAGRVQPKGGFQAEAAKRLAEYKKSARETPGYFEETSCAMEVSWSGDAVLSLAILTTAMQSTAAHGSSHQSYLNLDPRTGEEYSLPGILNPGAEPQLTAAAEREFRRKASLPPGQSLADAGYTFDGGRFRLSKQWGITTWGLVFYYNPYEVASYADTPGAVEVPWAAIQGLLKREAGIPPPQP
jgi:uncharacterized protein